MGLGDGLDEARGLRFIKPGEARRLTREIFVGADASSTTW